MKTVKKVNRYEITFIDEVEGKNVEEVMDDFLRYLDETVRYGDLTAFNFREIGGKKDE